MIKNVDQAIKAYNAKADQVRSGKMTATELKAWCRQQAIRCYDNRERLRRGDMVAAMQCQAAAQYFERAGEQKGY